MEKYYMRMRKNSFGSEERLVAVSGEHGNKHLVSIQGVTFLDQ
jgi:hypothetical protein